LSGLALDHFPSIYVFFWAERYEPTNMACWVTWNLAVFLLGLASSYESLNLYLLRSRDYRYAPQSLAIKIISWFKKKTVTSLSVEGKFLNTMSTLMKISGLKSLANIIINGKQRFFSKI
jgi:hypothetical protein